jgi:predicted permease
MLVVGVAIALGLRERHIIALLGAFASPAAVASFTMSKEMDVEPELAGEIVAVSTIMSLITMFGWIVSLKNMGII